MDIDLVTLNPYRDITFIDGDTILKSRIDTNGLGARHINDTVFAVQGNNQLRRRDPSIRDIGLVAVNRSHKFCNCSLNSCHVVLALL